MRFDDTLDTVLAADIATPAGAAAAWRQIVDLVGRGRSPADPRTIERLNQLRRHVPVPIRAASARAMYGISPPVALVEVLARDDIAVAAPVLRGCDLAADDWDAVLPILSPAGRAVLRHRRDLPAQTLRALESFGTVDFVLSGSTVEPATVGAAKPVPANPATIMAAEPTPAEPAPRGGTPTPFVSLGEMAREILARTQTGGNDNAVAPPIARSDGTFRISDVVARIEAFRQRQDDAANDVGMDPAGPPEPEQFRFETDATGAIRWVEGVSRAALIGCSLARPALPGHAGVDGVAAGAFRRRTRFAAARLLVAGSGTSAGDWTIAAVPAFDTASGRFSGYRGTARRPRADERAQPLGLAADSLRQLVHELRTPTNAIAGFSEMIEHQMLGPVSDPYRVQAAEMRHDAGRLLAAIDDLDTAARIDTGALSLRIEAVPVAEILDRVRAALAPLIVSRDAVLSIDGDAMVNGDAPALERLLNRLVATMLAAAVARETIAVTIRGGEAGSVQIAVDRPAALAAYPGDAVLEIDDEDTAASLLGTGFALRLVGNLAREMGGTLAIGHHRLTLRLPAAVERAVGKVQQN